MEKIELEKEYMTSFGVPIIFKIEGGGTIEELQESISKKLSAMDVSMFPSLKKPKNNGRRLST